MSIHLQRENEKLKRHLLSLCVIVEDQVQMTIEAFLQRDDNLALEVERRDTEVDQREVEVEKRNASRCSLCTSPWQRTCA